MSDWAVGDLAVCVDDSPCKCGRCNASPIPGLHMGRIYTVLGLSASLDGTPTLTVNRAVSTHPRHEGRRGAAAYRFRKILPDKHEACETEFVTLLQRIKRKQVA